MKKRPPDSPLSAKFDPASIERLREEFFEHLDEEFEMQTFDENEDSTCLDRSEEAQAFRKLYFRELHRMQGELVKMQDWVVANKKKVVVLFEGRDSAGKGGAISRIAQRLNPRVCRVAALPAPSGRERTQWYFQRYVSHLPAGGEIVLFDRSWYNRAGVERVMGFCTDAELEEFFQTVGQFEKMLKGSDIQLIKYWFSITDEEQVYRFNARIHDPMKRWKLSPMDLEARRRWEAYTEAKEEMFQRTSTQESPWWVIPANDKKRARLNCISHLLEQIPYQEIEHEPIELPEREHAADYERHEIPEEFIVPQKY